MKNNLSKLKQQKANKRRSAKGINLWNQKEELKEKFAKRLGTNKKGKK